MSESMIQMQRKLADVTSKLEKAERELAEAQATLAQEQEQEPVLCHAAFSNGDGTYSYDYVKWPLRPHEKPVHPVDRFFYARPVPANLVESHQIKRDSNSLEFEGIKTAPAVAVPSDDERLAQAIQNHSPTAFANSVAAINKPAVAVPMGSILQKVMAALAPMLDEDHFATIESIAASGGHEPPTGAVPAEWREVLTELADDLSIELDMRYQSRSHYPSELRKYENEMQPVYRARALLQSAEGCCSQAQNGDGK